MKTFRRILTLCLAMLLVLGLVACKNKKKGSDEDLVNSADLVLQIYGDADLRIGFDKKGKALAVVGDDEAGKEFVEICDDISGMSGTEAVNTVLKAYIENGYATYQPYIILRQDHFTTLPKKDFLTKIEESAQEVVGDIPLIVIGLDDMDDDGFCNGDVAKKIMLAFLADHGRIVSQSELLEGSYLFNCIDYEIEEVYSLSGYTGAIAPYQSLVGDTPMDEEDMIPEDQQFVPEGDHEEVVPEEPEEPEESAVD